jgi:hypothetical protein
MKQQTLAMANGFERYGKQTRRTLFLEEMEQVVPWSELCALIEPLYAKAGNGPPPVGAERMLRIYFLQPWFNLSDPGVEEALYDWAGMRQFVGIDLGREPVPDETTVHGKDFLLLPRQPRDFSPSTPFETPPTPRPSLTRKRRQKERSYRWTASPFNTT